MLACAGAPGGEAVRRRAARILTGSRHRVPSCPGAFGLAPSSHRPRYRRLRKFRGTHRRAGVFVTHRTQRAVLGESRPTRGTVTGIARAYGSIDGHLVSTADGALAWSDLTQAQKDARNEHADRQRSAWALTQNLERLDAVLARTEARSRAGALTADQAASIAEDVEAEAAPLRAELAALRALDDVMSGETIVLQSAGKTFDHWELLWRLRSMRGPINWSIRPAAPEDAPMPVAAALEVLGDHGEPLPPHLRALLTSDSPGGGVKTLNDRVTHAVAEARTMRNDRERCRSA